MNEDKLKEIIDTYSQELLRLCYLYLHNVDAAYEIVQIVFIKVYLNYHQFKGNSKEKTWIVRITINECKNYLKSSWKTKIVLENDVSNQMATLAYEQEFASNEEDELLGIIYQLPKRYKEVLLLYYYEEFKIWEISNILHISQSTVGSRLVKARSLLKQSMKERDVYEKFQGLL